MTPAISASAADNVAAWPGLVEIADTVAADSTAAAEVAEVAPTIR